MDIKDRGGVLFSTLISDSAVLIFENNSLYENYEDDPETLLRAYRDQTYWQEWLVAYPTPRPLRIHQEYYPAGGVSAFPLSYNIDQKYTSTEDIFTEAQPLTLHEHGHHISYGYMYPTDGYGEPAANLTGDAVKEILNMTPSSSFSRINLARTWLGIDLNGGSSHSSSTGAETQTIAEIARSFGPQAYHNLFARFRSTPTSELDTLQERLDHWLLFAADETGYNLSPWLEQWMFRFTPATKIAVSGLPKWNKIELIPRSLIVMQNNAVTFDQPWTSDWSYDGVKQLVGVTAPANGTLVDNQDGTCTYTPNTDFTGDDAFDYSIQNSVGNVFTNTVNIRVTEVAHSPKLAMGQVTINTSTWTTVTLSNSYTSMVVTTTPVELPGTPPYVTRIRNASGSSFEILAQRVDGQVAPLSGLIVYYLAAEEGVYNPTDHGIRMEAVKHLSTRTDSAYHFTLEMTNYLNRREDHYSNPTIFGQVMTYNDPDWSVFWNASTYRETYSAGGGGMYIGKHVGEDPDVTRADETLGIIVFDTKVPVVHYGDYRLQLDGFGEGTVPNLSRTATTYSVMGNPPNVIGGMIGAGGLRSYGSNEQGYWPVFVGPEPFKGGNALTTRIVQDRMADNLENSSSLGNGPRDCLLLSYFGDNVVANDDIAVAYGLASTCIEVLGNDAVPFGGAYAVTAVTQGTHGSVTVHADGTVSYVQSANSTGSDSFSYTVSNGVDSDTATVYVDRRYTTGSPIFFNDPIVRNAAEDVAFNGTISGEAGDPDGGSVTYSKTAGPVWLSIASDGALSGTPSTDDMGTNTFTVTASNGGGSTSATLLIEVANTPDAPQFDSDPVWGPTVIFNQVYPYPSLEDYASDPDGDPLTFARISGPTWLTVYEEGYLEGTPTSGDIGINEFIVEVSDGVLTDQVTLLIEVRGASNGYVGYWPMDEGEGTVAEDMSNYGNDGEISGATWTTGMLNGGLDLSSAGSTVTMGDLGTSANAYTWAIWANFPAEISAGSPRQVLATYGGNIGQEVIGLGSYSSYATNETLTLSGQIGSSIKRTYIRDTLTAGWHHVAFSWDSGIGRYRIYVDGIQKTVYASSFGHTPLMLVSNLLFGKTSSYSGFAGKADDVRIYEKALSGSEISDLYNSYFEPQNTPPVFTANPIIEIDAMEAIGYHNSLSDDTLDPDGADTLTFVKIAGPSWLSVSTDGILSGTPTAGDIGLNSWTVEVTDGHGPGIWALLKIRVRQPGDITGDEKVDLEDFAFLVSYWLLDCDNDPLCEKANLDTLRGVDMDDLMILAGHWLAASP